MHIRNGMPAADLGIDGWARPWSGPNGGDCLEAKKLPGGRVALRQSTDPDGPALILEPNEIRAFVAAPRPAWPTTCSPDQEGQPPGRQRVTSLTFPAAVSGNSSRTTGHGHGIRER